MAVLSADWSFNAHTMSIKKQTGEKHTLVLNDSFFPQLSSLSFPFFRSFSLLIITYNILLSLLIFYEFSNMLDDRVPTLLGNEAVHFENHKENLL